MLVNHHQHLLSRKQSITILSESDNDHDHEIPQVVDDDDDDNDEELILSSTHSKKAPNSFLLFKAKRRHESAHGKSPSSLQLIKEWEAMSKEQKAEFQNQSECIQFTLDIDNRHSPRKQLPKIVVPSPSSMVIPNDHSVDSSPREYELFHHHLHPLSDLLVDPFPNSHHSHHNPYFYNNSHHSQHPHQITEPSSPTTPSSSSSSSYSHHHHHHRQQHDKHHHIYNHHHYHHPHHHSPVHNNTPNNTNNSGFTKLMSYSAAAEAAALESLSFTPPPPPSPAPSAIVQKTPNIKKKYGILPEKVKRPPNAYLLFNRDMRRQLHDVNQGLSSGEISKSISLRWKQLSPEEKEYYIKEESKLKQQHNNEHANFIYTRRSKAEMREAGSLKKSQNKTTTIAPLSIKKQPTTTTTTTKKKSTPATAARLLTGGRDPRGRKKKKADDTLPKHPMSGYLHFAKEMRPIMKKKFPDARLVEISKQIGSQWRAMTEKELRPWIDKANRDKERYAQEMKDRLSNPMEEEEDNQSISSHTSFMNKRKFSSTSSSSAATTAVMEELDSHTIATVAQMVNPLNNNNNNNSSNNNNSF